MIRIKWGGGVPFKNIIISNESNEYCDDNDNDDDDGGDVNCTLFFTTFQQAFILF